VLLVDDDPLDAALLVEQMRHGDLAVATRSVGDRPGFEAALDDPPDLILCDFSLPGFNAFDALATLRERALDIPLIVVSGASSEEKAVECMRRGAADYLLKDRMGRLVWAIERSLLDHRLREEARALREQSVERQRMETVGRLAGGIAHDFNNILAAIVTFAEIAQLEIADDAPGRREIGEILHAADRAAALIRQILDFSRRQVLQPSELNLAAVVHDLDAILRRQLGSHITLSVEATSEPALIFADRTQIEQAILNLVVNAAEALSDGGGIEIAIEHQLIDERSDRQAKDLAPGNYVRMSVRDTGTGMDRTTLDRIFEPVFPTREVGRGTGPGLAAAYGIIEQSGGTILVDSRAGEGSRFVILLPALGGASEPSDRLASATLPGHRPPSLVGPAPLPVSPPLPATILLAEDDPALRSLMARIFSARGWTTVTASDGLEALQLAREAAAIHLLVTDMQMPGLTGAELAQRLLDAGTVRRVLVISGYAGSTQLPEAGPGARVVALDKPFSVDTLVAAVTSLLAA